VPAGAKPTLYARLCFRLSLQRERSALELLGLPGVESRERAQAAAPSGRGFHGRFDAPGFPVLYAAETLATCEAEVRHHLIANHLKGHAASRPRTFTFAILEVPISGLFDDLRRPLPGGLTAPGRRAYPAARQYAMAAFRAGLDGLLYGSPRDPGGTCVARFLPDGLRLPWQRVGTRTLSWKGRRFE